MKSVYLNGIGLVSRAGNSPDAVAEAVLSPEECPPQALAYESFFEKSEMRRISRYAKLAAEVSARALQDAGTDPRTACDENTGILFTTGYGAAESNVKFFKSVAKKEPDFCNPLTFASTVPNYALGTVCILLGIKGYSTALLGGNPFDLAVPALHRQKAESMIIGAQEEYCPEMFEAVEHCRASHAIQLAEGSIAFLVSAKPDKNCYAELTDSKSYALTATPVFDSSVSIPDSAVSLAEKPDVIFGIGEQLPFGEAEKKLFSEAFPDAVYSGVARSLFGETMGSSFLLNAACAAVCLKKGIAPAGADARTVLVTGADMQGNYMQVLLKKTEMEKYDG